jgi:hypothetical protein
MRTGVVDGVRERCSLCQGDGYVSIEGSPIPPGIIGVQLSDDVKFYGRVRTHLEADPDEDTQPIDMADVERRSVATTQDKLLALGLRQCLAMEKIGRSLADLEASLRAIVDDGLQVRHG